LHHPGFAPLFGPSSRAEVAVSGLVGALPVSGQIDRLAVEEERVLIVDYKTNRPPPSTPQEVAPLYLRQLAAYRALLARIYPDREISCALLWTDAAVLMEIPPALLDAHTPSESTVS
ncbi:MAG: PD-(D/E)XK nuclease family protein, partial [Alphaproteobacteria bacterium]|nr:PD-(D/E)XK nuclease family protein [Alphaproteobacteria bacterium]